MLRMVLGGMVVVAIALGIVIARKVRANGNARLFALGEHMMAVGTTQPSPRNGKLEITYQGKERELRINGQTLLVRVEEQRESLESVLDEAERYCKAHGGWLADFVAESVPVPKRKRQQLRNALVDMPPVAFTRLEGTGQGVVHCIEADANSGLPTLDRLVSYAVSQDVGELGSFYYVYAAQAHDGSEGSVAVYVRTLGSFKLGGLGASQGDVGSDIPAVPRPRGPFVRKYSAQEPSAGTYTAMYVAKRAMDHEERTAVLANYLAGLPSHGWRIAATDYIDATTGAAWVLAQKDNAQVTLVTRPVSRGRTAVLAMRAPYGPPNHHGDYPELVRDSASFTE